MPFLTVKTVVIITIGTAIHGFESLPVFSILFGPITLFFLFTTHPTSLTASLARVGVSSKIAYAVNLTLRYLPILKTDFLHIYHAQQTRGLNYQQKLV